MAVAYCAKVSDVDNDFEEEDDDDDGPPPTVTDW
jgi:hypothetical protein